jgi:predicted DsbA family dithiol-disulfide isomerase/uncharacterized membrane protein
VKSAPWLLVIRVAALIALGVSGALWADYTGPSPTYCGAASGCGAIRQAGWGYIPIFGQYIPVPAVGTVGFAALLGVSLIPDRRVRQWLTAGGAILAGALGIALLSIQAAVIGTFCALCVVVDVSAIVAGAAGIALVAGKQEPAEPLEAWSWVALGLLAFLAPWYWPSARPAPDVPVEIQKLYKPGKINVVEFADFECPFCRLLHTTLQKLTSEYEGRVNLVRLNMPLASHPDARDAAKAFICADEQGQGQTMGDRLFEAKSLRRDALRAHAQSLALDLERFDACLDSRDTEARIDRESAILRNAGFDGLPTTYIGSMKIIGAQPEEVFRAAFERSERGVGQRGVPWPIYVLVALGAAAGVAYAGRKRQSV